MTDEPHRFTIAEIDLLASALHAQLMMRRRATLEHDVKNVVHGLLSGTELLAKSLNSNSPRITPNECLNLLQQQLGRAHSTLNRMLEEIAPRDEAETPTDLGALVSECTHALRHALQGFAIHSAVTSGSTVQVRVSRFKDMLMSILFACVDRAPPRSRLDLSASPSADRVVLTIQHLLSQEALPVNLAWVRDVLAADRIELTASSSDGKCRIELSIATLNASSRDAATHAPRLVIVDGNRDAADSLALLTQIEGFDPVATYDAGTALNTLKQGRPAAVLVDLDGSIDSAMLIGEARSFASDLKLIGLSHSSSRASAAVDACLGKPLDLSALRKIIGTPG